MSLPSKASASRRAVEATAPPGGRCLQVTAILLLAPGLATILFAATEVPGSNGQAAGLRVRDRQVLVGPEGEPFNMPSDAAVGPDGDLYVLDGVQHRVVVFGAEGHFRRQFGTQGNDPGQLLFPLGIAAGSDGKIYVADSGNHRIQVFARDGRPLAVVPLPSAESNVPPDPTDAVVDAVRQRLYIADNDNHHILVYNLEQGRFESVWGRPGQGRRQFRYPFLLDLSADGYLLVVESINTRVQVLNPDGKFVRFIGAWGVEAGQLFRPKGVAVDGNHVYVADSYLGNVQVFDLSGTFLGPLTDAAGTPMKFTTPTGVAVDSKRRRVYVVELKANQVCRVDLE
jgi:DNA-binding beta-propeller fold protein YncE